MPEDSTREYNPFRHSSHLLVIAVPERVALPCRVSTSISVSSLFLRNTWVFRIARVLRGKLELSQRLRSGSGAASSSLLLPNQAVCCARELPLNCSCASSSRHCNLLAALTSNSQAAPAGRLPGGGGGREVRISRGLAQGIRVPKCCPHCRQIAVDTYWHVVCNWDR